MRGSRRTTSTACARGPRLSGERASELWGLNPRWSGSGDAAQCIIEATMAINCGLCTTVALVYGNAQRSMDTAYGGARVTGGGITSYFYYAPWGLTSQGALYALFFQRHKLLYGTTEEQLGAIAVAFRKHACLNPNAVMQKPLTIDDYMKAPYVAEPLRLFDYCLINDGGVAIIVRRADMAKDLKQKPVHGERHRLVRGKRRCHAAAAASQGFLPHGASRRGAADLSRWPASRPRTSTCSPPTTASACTCSPRSKASASARRARAVAFVQNGRIEIGGELPCNTSGGMLSESYMQSWNHQPELVRQLRGGLGARQVQGRGGRAVRARCRGQVQEHHLHEGS